MNAQSPCALVIDDTSLSAKKFSAALKAIDVPSEIAGDGLEGLERLRAGGIDLVLLNIVMPKLDGFGVLRAMRQEAALCDVPVLVISSLTDPSDAVEALKLGAVDFLTKDVDPAIFRARVQSCLEKKRLRDLELTYLADVQRLTLAAQRVRNGETDPDKLQITPVISRRDSLGQLAEVFTQLAVAVREREQKARRRITLLQGSLLLLIMGLTWGVVPALSKLMVNVGVRNPIGAAAWVSLITLCMVSVLLLVQGRRLRLSKSSLQFGLVAGLFAGVAPQVVLFWVSGHLSGVVISITLALESLIVFCIAALLRLEAPNSKRLVGLLVGLLAVVIIIVPGAGASGIDTSLWVLAGLIVPLCYALESILVAAMPDREEGPLEILFLIALGSTVWAWSVALLTSNFMSPSTMTSQMVLFLVAIGALSTISTGCFIVAIRKMGAVFASQYAYVATIMGVGWSVLLLGESLTLSIWLSLACVLVGMYLVRPKENTELLDEVAPAVPSKS